MVDKCGGLPLAVVILSGLLLQKKTYTFWSEVKDHLWRNLKGKSSEIQELLNLSYDELPYQTRQCFLYLARYPEDHIIEVFELKLLWIAEEFVSEGNEGEGVDMEDLAEDHVNELINRNMIQIQLLSADGQVLQCRIHDLVRDLAIEKAMEDKKLGIFDSSKQHPNPIRLLQGQSRHAINNGISEYLKLLVPNFDHLKLRSLAVTNESARVLEVEEMKLMYTRFKYLKVLDLTGVEYSEGMPEEIVILLKFLGLMGGDSLVMPPSIGKLKRLQTLRGSGSYSTKFEFPKEVRELKELRHLIFSQKRGALNIGSNQTKLQTIKRIMYTEWFRIDTINLTNLHTLVIIGDEGEYGLEYGFEYSFESIANLSSLRTLIIKLKYSYISTIQPLSFCKQLKRVTLMGRIKDPSELSFLPDSVTDLNLMRTCFSKDPMPTLGSLSNLTALRLGLDAFIGNKMVCSAGGFACLQFLKLVDLDDPKEFQVDDEAMPSLKAFQMDTCYNIRDKIPQRIMSLPRVPEFWDYLC